jgi:hypothetical protein
MTSGNVPITPEKTTASDWEGRAAVAADEAGLESALKGEMTDHLSYGKHAARADDPHSTKLSSAR